MMGRRKGAHGQLFYAFDLDTAVPEDHLVRRVASVLDLSWVHREQSPHYSHTGRPSIDPELMIRISSSVMCSRSAQNEHSAERFN